LLIVFSCTNTPIFEPRSQGDFQFSNKLGVSGTEEEFVPGEYVVQFEPREDAVKALSSVGAEIVRTYSFEDVQIVTVRTESPELLNNLSGVKSVDKTSSTVH